ncbi:tRNA preQ1(34) S-adenosylmethionine ribosyltransferase-isomerase QueA [Silvibacterium dinghuense]|uniref:S-adenosylmethionine:tRNA ribosyltransferase-isomerase n=1 Tax=Silvibacterium dinghuense TaxID=1560006 RepID=A0A4Q1SEC3_9BACT|nr:tRNA preQ1(34) S-adenosylmethionine ribosyltransferase-isomerase QueA [Silvibacterium dinghuense]RXS95614.1 tRNA preQ1(34) S-adenosylmethionine ribosyltransferase-isomerase QueA [Silvibacterium dinghuense]GGH14419.1 S-adenosylmethionine:tRNA ribosyltransferase-isomerase [Silvibacterium dinghuense]
MLVTDFDYELPEELIAQQPPSERSGARMLLVDRNTGHWQDSAFQHLPEQLREGDLLVLNNSRVIPARLYGRRVDTASGIEHTGRIEVFLTTQRSEWEWEVLVKPGRKVQPGTQLVFGAGDLHAEVLDRGEFGERTLRFQPVPDFFAALEALGRIPLPPYIHRGEKDADSDRERYQTVFAEDRGSVAAPTAGLHFTPEILDRIRQRGVEVAYVTLHVGLGTFQPVRVERLEDIHLHTERYTLPEATATALNAARREGRRIVAAGTTTVRTLEHCALLGEEFTPHAGSTNIFISPGFRFRAVNALLTNFHLPQSTLLMLVSAFAGQDHVLAAYRHAVAERYRFFSYGDCMFLS